MITVLVVDDAPSKIDDIRASVVDAILHEDVRVTVESTVSDAIDSLSAHKYDVLILDINLPIRKGESARLDGGMKVLEAINQGGQIQKPSHIIGLTAYSNLQQQYSAVFEEGMWHLVTYSAASTDWAEGLKKKLMYIAESKLVGGFQNDLCIIGALEVPELAAILKLPADWNESPIEGDDTRYYAGNFQRDGNALRVVAACCLDMGMPAATALAMKMIENFRPRYLAIVGIAAGISGNYGDVLIADQAFDYGSGKSKSSWFRGVIFEPAPVPILLSPLLKTKFGAFSRRSNILDRIRRESPEEIVPWELGAKRGPIASGAAVLENWPLIQQIRRRDRKLVGIEMETYGVFVAARCCREPRPLAMSIKSICDFGDSKKNDDYQAYAAYTSARYLYEFALVELQPPSLDRLRSSALEG
jgi:nucleoside phosphorylase/CheY-like chemotaxis protein